MQPWQHAKFSAKKFGRTWSDYLALHEFLDSTKIACPDLRHRIVLHNSDLGLALAKQRFPNMPQRSELVYAHVQQDLKSLPSLQDWLSTAQFPPRIQCRYVDSKALILQATEKTGAQDIQPCKQVYDLLTLGEQYCADNSGYGRLILMNSFGPALVRQIMGPAYEIHGKVFDPAWVAEGIIVSHFGRIPSLCEVLTPFTGKLNG